LVDVSVIMACLDAEETLPEALASLTSQVWDGALEILLCDNGSTDASAAIFAAHARRHPGVAMRRIDASARRGKVHALNAGLAAARGDAFLFLDCDDTVAPGWLAAMAGALGRHDFVAAFTDPGALNEGWVEEYRARRRETLRRLTHPPFCRLAGGAEMGFTRRLYETVGGFDPAFAVQEDHDFCVRAHLAGFALEPVPEARYNYRFRADFGAIYRQAYAYARYRALLRRRYAREPFLSPRPWLALSRRLLRLGGGRALAVMSALGGRAQPPLEQAQRSARLGQALGEAAGAFAYRVPPPSRLTPPPDLQTDQQPDLQPARPAARPVTRHG
jgi:glycosyltransferase involved in cell wall biosynthesis